MEGGYELFTRRIKIMCGLGPSEHTSHFGICGIWTKPSLNE